ncbi:aldehyde dehydrogenase (NADP(+)) [Amnibacterium flavum]|uniref:Aldehyde dehydrogenase (NADP(+)) n=1 Tax=Amnibacterium flavum TaxID=2173173 RepID=A0A2V1HNV3_9MICO|nr:aldehyde dehydrogenase (NADP(+)) [Amnibacterium flavum]PVZ94195.1 aldehyde dehydrogenase (NADP(+)) [Amnibacterium flavum]
MLTTTDPRTGERSETTIEPTTTEEVHEVAARAAAAFTELAGHGRIWRAALLDALADGLEARRDELVATADSETGLGAARLGGELTRSAFQLRLFGEALRDGGYLEATIDHAGDTPMGPGPDLRRMLVPIGPIAVFGSSNFPFAFSVPGGDTASGLAAGCPVVLKAHSSHLLTSALAYEALSDAATAYGAPEGTLGIVFGTQAGAALVADPRIKAVGFTGSLGGGQALLDIIEKRDEPIPFYGELSSLNPLIITEGAATERAADIAQGLFGSFTLGAGQFCTKPGVAFVPRGAAGESIVDGMIEKVTAAAPGVLLNSRISESFGEIRERLIADGHATLVATGQSTGEGFSAAPSLLTIDASDVTADVTEEAFGPLIVVAYYDDISDIEKALRHIPKSLTATIHNASDETELTADLARRVSDYAGRLVFNGYPTGVRVSWGQHHGGPWPATNSQHTSVGVTAIRRFLRPFAWQDAPETVLPEELRDGYTGVPRRVDGVLSLAS